MALVPDASVKQAHAQREAVERDLTRVYARALRELGEWIISTYNLPEQSTSITAAGTESLTSSGLMHLLDKWNSIVATTIRPAMLRAFVKHWGWVSNNIQASAPGIDTRVILGENVRDVRASKGFESAEPRIRDIGRSLHAELMTTLRNSYDAGATPADAAQAIRDTVGERMLGRHRVTAARALMIARTETAALVSGADQAAAEELHTAGITAQKEWLSTHDRRTRPSHQRANGQKVDVHGNFMVGSGTLRYPGDPLGPADEVVNCRCTTLLRVEEEPSEVVSLYRAAKSTTPETFDYSGLDGLSPGGYGFAESDQMLSRMSVNQGWGVPELLPSQAYAQVTQDWEQMYRGFGGSLSEAESRAKGFSTDDEVWTGTGVYGNGHYFVTGGLNPIATAERYAEGNGKVLQAALRPEAKVIDYRDLQQLTVQYTIGIKRLPTEAPSAARVPISQDPGKIAVLHGYDAIRRVFPDGESYLVVLNRSAVVVKEGWGN